MRRYISICGLKLEPCRNKEEITPEVLEDAAIFVIPSPKEKFTENEFNTLKGYLDGGGAVLVTLGEGGEKNFETNINYLLEEYGLMINNGEFLPTKIQICCFRREIWQIGSLLGCKSSTVCSYRGFFEITNLDTFWML